MQGPLILIHPIVKLAQILNKRPIIQVGSPIDAKLALEIVATRIDELMGALALRVSHLAHHHSVFLPSCSIYHEFALELATHQRWLEDCM